MHVLFIAGWCDPFGDFIKEHAYSIAQYCKVSYVYVSYTKRVTLVPFKRVWSVNRKKDTDQYFIAVSSPVRRFGIYEFLIKRAYSQVIRHIEKERCIDICHI